MVELTKEHYHAIEEHHKALKKFIKKFRFLAKALQNNKFRRVLLLSKRLSKIESQIWESYQKFKVFGNVNLQIHESFLLKKYGKKLNNSEFRSIVKTLIEEKKKLKKQSKKQSNNKQDEVNTNSKTKKKDNNKPNSNLNKFEEKMHEIQHILHQTHKAIQGIEIEFKKLMKTINNKKIQQEKIIQLKEISQMKNPSDKYKKAS